MLPPSQQVTVEKVLDGDTVVLKGMGSLRLAGIDAPERGQPTRLGRKDEGEWSRRCLSKRLESRRFTFLYHGRDIYGRMLGDLVSKKPLSLELVEEGCVSIYPLSTTTELIRAYHQARQKRVGLWAFGGFERPYHFRKKKARWKRALRPGRKSGS